MPGDANRLLGFPPDARLLIVNADDFGFCSAVNAAIMRALPAGFLRSTTLMTPCPWAPQAVDFLAANPEIPFGIHLTVISDPDGYRWGPLAPPLRVPSLLDSGRYFYNFDRFHAHLPLLKLDELELEFRSQIAFVLAAGLKPTHLDWHAIRFGARTDIFDLMVRLAREYGLALRVIGQSAIAKLQGQGLPTIDHTFLDSYGIAAAAKPAEYLRLLRELPAGLSEWAIHPAFDNLELQAIDPGGAATRQADFDFLTSPAAQQVAAAEGIILLDYRTLQPHWTP